MSMITITTNKITATTMVDRADLPKGLALCPYNGFHFPKLVLQGVINAETNFKARDSDILLASLPKAGTTWLKALAFSIVNRHMYDDDHDHDQSPLLVSNPHDLVPSLEIHVYMAHMDPDLHLIPSPRIFATHAPHRLLPDSIPGSGCKIIYISRNPLDQFVSYGHFKRNNGLLLEDEAFDAYCRGVHPYGPFWDHVAEYYEASLRDPRRVLFLGYEELSEDVVSSVEKVAEFVGLPFSEEERGRGVVEEIARVCSIDHLKGLEVNSKEAGNKQLGVVENCSFFRKGKVGDWKNHLTVSMADKVERILEEKLSGTGLAFDINRGSYVKRT